VTLAQVALAWVIAEGVIPIPGMRRRSRLDENVGAVGLALSDAERAELAQALPAADIVGTRDYVEVEVGVDR